MPKRPILSRSAYGPGKRVRVRVTGRRVAPYKLTVDGRVGVVVATSGTTVLVEFAAERVRAMFQKVDLVPATDPPPRPRGKRERGGTVAAILDDQTCFACGGRHTLCYTDDDLIEDRAEYEYVCPATQQVVRFRTSEWNRVDRCPPNAVGIRPTGK